MLYLHVSSLLNIFYLTAQAILHVDPTFTGAHLIATTIPHVCIHVLHISNIITATHTYL